MRTVLLMSFLMSVLSFNNLIYDRDKLINYVTKGTWKYMKNYVKLEDLKQQTFLSYYTYKDSITFPINTNDPIIKKMFHETMKYSHHERKHKMKNCKLLDYIVEKQNDNENIIINHYSLLKNYHQLNKEEKTTISMLIDNKSSIEICEYHKYTFQRFKKHIKNIKKKVFKYVS